MNERTATSGEQTHDDVPGTYLAAPAVTPGTQIGRYLALERIGAGGMGVVFAAYDPELDRRVAVKVVRDDAAAGSDARRARLLGEARAMARLDHPHVLQVFDAGTTTVGGSEQVFVAMELVDGVPLGEWARDRVVDDVLRALVAAGRGLAAAHAAGLVHRDFKPDNVLVDREDHVRVADFGLAEPALGPGAAMGTPAFMAPEQHRGEPVDARADQFAFCVTVWLLVFGQHPFAGEDKRAAILAGEIAPVTPGPRWLEPLLRTGLAPEPAARHPSLDVMLDAIEQHMRPRRTWFVVGGIAALAAAVALGMLVAKPAATGPSCPTADARLAGVWDANTRAALAKRGHAGAATAAALDVHARQWAEAHAAVCAARERGAEPAGVLDRREACIELRRSQLAAAAARLTAAADDLLASGPAIVDALPSPRACGDAQSVQLAMSLPDERGLRAVVEEAQAQLGVADALVVAGQHAEATKIMTALAPMALAYAPFAAEVAHVRADLATEREEAPALALYDDAIRIAASVGHDYILIRSILDRAWHLEPQEAERWFAFAAGAIARLGDPPELLAHLHGNRAALRHRTGDLEAALADARRCYELRRTHDGPASPLVANAAVNLGAALHAVGRDREARDVSMAALAAADAVLPPDHRVIRSLLENLVGMHVRAHDGSAARVAFERLFAMTTRTFGPDHPVVASLELERGNILALEGKHAEAVVAFETAVANELRRHGDNTVPVAIARANLSVALVRAKREADGEAESERAVATFERALGAEHPALVTALANHGYTLYRMRKLAPAEDWLRRAVALAKKTLPPDSPSGANAHASLGLVLATRGKHVEARTYAQRGIAIATDKPAAQATGELALAHALDGLGDRAGAVAAAQRALALYTKLGPSSADERADTEAFLAARR